MTQPWPPNPEEPEQRPPSVPPGYPPPGTGGWVWQGPPPPSPPPRKSDGLRVIQVLLVVLAFLGLVGAGILLLTALPTQANGEAFCGPGTTSDSALEVRINPDVVNTGPGSDSVSAADKSALRSVCLSAADRRIIEVAVLVGASLLIGGAGPVVARKAWHRSG